MEPEATQQMPLPHVQGSPGVLGLLHCRRQPELPQEGRAARHTWRRKVPARQVLWDLGNSTARASEKVSPRAKKHRTVPREDLLGGSRLSPAQGMVFH